MMHDLLRWEYHAKLWGLDHPWIYLALLIPVIYLWWVNR